jgi:hypothetical protein
MKHFFSYLSILFIGIIYFTSCQKKEIITNKSDIRFSKDTLLFDTVFTNLGSATYLIKIYNDLNRPVNISSIRLENGSNSLFKLNINGFSGNIINNQEIAANDSLYVYSVVTINPNLETNPFVVEDKLIVSVNQDEYSVPVIAYGQNANYIVDSVLKTQTWNNRLPYVIINNALVDKNNTLTIEKGARIYMHPHSRLYVDGTLLINGTKNDSVVFQSNRIDRSYFGYRGYPGEWGGIYFTENSNNNHLKWTVIKNGGSSTKLGNATTQAASIQVDNNKSLFNPQDGVYLENCIVENSIGYGILSFGGKLKISNSLVNTCGSQNIGIFQGGNYFFEQSTFVTYGSKLVAHIDAPVISVLNYLDTSNTGFIPDHLKFVANNCIFYGSLKNEVIGNAKNIGISNYDVQFKNSILKLDETEKFPGIQLENCIINQEPLFEDKETWNYRLKAGSVGFNTGAPPFYGENLDGQSGTNNIGAY